MNSNEQKNNEQQNENPRGGWGRRQGGGRKRWFMPIIFLAILAVKSAAVMYLWNALIPDLFHGPLLTYVQALGLSILARLFVGFHGFGGHRGGFGRGGFGGGGWGHRHGRHRFGNMSKEEREKLKAEFIKRFDNA